MSKTTVKPTVADDLQTLVASSPVVSELDTTTAVPSAEDTSLTADPSGTELDTADITGSKTEAAPPLMAVSAPNGLNLRQGPAILFPVMAVLAEGEEVELLPLPQGAEVPGWALVDANGDVGWVDTRFLVRREA